MKKIFLTANSSWYLHNYRLTFAGILQSEGYETIFVSPVDEYTPYFAEYNIKHFPIEIDRKSINPFTDWKVVREFRKLYLKEQPDLVHHHNSKNVIYGTIAATGLDISVVNSITGLGYIFSHNSLRARLLKPILMYLYQVAFSSNQCKSVIFQNQSNRNLFITNFIVDHNKTVYIPGSGAESSKFHPEPENLEGEVVVSLPTRMLWGKGVGIFVEAAKILRSRNRNYHLHLYGMPDEGNPDSIPEKTINEWASNGWVEWKGWESNMDALYSRSNIIVYPSLYGEGLPRTLIEASLCQRAIIASDIPGCQDIIKHQENGLLCPPENPTALADQIDKLASDPQLRKNLAVNARKDALHYFEHGIVARKTQEVYSSILEN